MDPLLGSIILFAGGFAPTGYALCNGQLLSISQNSALYSILGTTYGGDGTSTFALPDLRSRVPVGAGQGTGLSNYALGQPSGAENVTLTTLQLPSHGHAATCNSAPGTQPSPAAGVWAQGPSAGKGAGSPNQYAAASDGSSMSPVAIAATGGSQPHPNIQPVLALNYIIAIQGVYPSRQ